MKRISSGKSFIDKMKFAAPGAKKGIRDELRNKGFNVTSASLGEVCFEIMKAFLKNLKMVKNLSTLRL